jgi:hypothetical protein
MILGSSRGNPPESAKESHELLPINTPYLKDAMIYRRNGSQGSQDHLHLDQRLADVVNQDRRTLAKTVSNPSLTLR